jgi:predicted alpha/beta superfamily hydrolase
MKSFLSVICISSIQFFSFAQKDTSAAFDSKKPFSIGIIDELDSKILNEKRILNIYLPDGYNENDSTKYNVIYLLDGSGNEDFIHIAGLVQFYSFDWINQVPKSIVVGIENVDRKRDFTFPSKVEEDRLLLPNSGRSEDFIAFIERELQPYINENYKVSNVNSIIGQSLGGLLATEILLKKTSLFDNYIIVSPSLWWDNGSLLNYHSELFSSDLNLDTKVYIAVGKEGLTPTEIPRVMEVDANLLADQLTNSKFNHTEVFFDYLPSLNHATILHQAVSNSFNFLFQNSSSQK